MLDRLRKADPELRDGPLDLDALVRRILHRGPAAPVDADERERLYLLLTDAYANGWADSLGALGAYHAMVKGVLSHKRDRYFTRGGRRFPGLNWGSEKVVTLETDRVSSLRRLPNGQFTSAGRTDAPWRGGPPPYVVVASGRHDMVRVAWPDGTSRDVPVDEFVELVARDPDLARLPADAPIVLAIPHAGDRGLDLPRLLAERTGRTVWSHSGFVTIAETSPGIYSIGTFHEPGRTIEGDWIASRPGMAPDRTADTPSWWRKVVNRTLVGLTGQRFGRVAMRPEENAENDHEPVQRRLGSMTHYAHYNIATRRWVSAKLPLPRPGKPGVNRYFFEAHGEPGYVAFPLEDGFEYLAPDREAARYVAHRRSVRELGKDDWIELVICWVGSPRHRGVQVPAPDSESFSGSFVPDPLAQVPVGQHMANETRRRVNCTVHVDAMGIYDDGEYIRPLYTDHRGRRGAYTQFFPEPDAAELARRARVAGFHTGPGEPSDAVLERTLRLVRALRLTLGNEIDDDVRVDQDPAYAELLRGAAALDRMAQDDPEWGSVGPFTLDFLDQVVAANLPPGTVARQGDYRSVLTRAAMAHPKTKLRHFVTLPDSLDRALDWFSFEDVAGTAARVLDLSGPGAVGGHELSRMFWARAKAEGAFSDPALAGITARMLSLAPGTEPTPAQLNGTKDLIMRAVAIGLDGTDPNVLFPYYLVRDGALSDDTALSAPATPHKVSGRDFRGTSNGILRDVSKIDTASGPVDAPWTGKDQYGDDKPAPYLVEAAEDPQAADRVVVTVNSRARSLSHQEFAELLALDEELYGEPLTTPVLLDIPSLAFPQMTALMETLAQHLGRRIWCTTRQYPIDPVDPQNPDPAPMPVRPPVPHSAGSRPAPPPSARRLSTVVFEPGSTRVSEDDVADLEDLADELAPSLLADWRAGRPLPGGQVTGFGEGTRDQAQQLGQERAETVLAWFTDSLDAALARLQRNVPEADRLTAAHLAFTARGQGAGPETGAADPEASRRTTIELTTPAGAPTRPAPTPAPAPEPTTAGPASRSASESAPASDSGTDLAAPTAFRADADAHTDTDADTATGTKADTAAGTDTDTDLGSVFDAVPGPGSDTESDSDTESPVGAASPAAAAGSDAAVVAEAAIATSPASDPAAPGAGTVPDARPARSEEPATAPVMTAPVSSTPGWARGRPLPVAADGNCMLHAFLASDPLLVRDRLPALSGPGRSAADRDAHAWLSEPGAVRTELARGGAPGPTDRHVLDAIRQFLANYLTRSQGRLPADIVRQYRGAVPEGPATDVAAMDEVELVTRLTGLGVPVPVPDRSRFPGARELVGELRDLVLRNTPLTPAELAGLRSAVLDWGNRWNTAVGDTFPHLLAHAFGVRMTLAWSRHRPDGRTLQRGLRPGIGPESATWEIELFHRGQVDGAGRPVDGTEHYEGSDARPRLVSGTAAAHTPLAAPPAGGPAMDPGPAYSGRPAGRGTHRPGPRPRPQDRPADGRPGGTGPGAARRGGERRGGGRRRQDP
ncbi:lonely Cys domain-containing protein, partial [Streptomyces albus]